MLLFRCIPALYNLSGEKQTYVRIFFGKSRDFFRVIHNLRGKERKGDQKLTATLQRKPGRREKKGDPQAGQRGRLFEAGIFVGACFFVCRPFWSGGLRLPFERLRFG